MVPYLMTTDKNSVTEVGKNIREKYTVLLIVILHEGKHPAA